MACSAEGAVNDDFPAMTGLNGLDSLAGSFIVAFCIMTLAVLCGAALGVRLFHPVTSCWAITGQPHQSVLSITGCGRAAVTRLLVHVPLVSCTRPRDIYGCLGAPCCTT